jgi:hypothetical protein
VPTGGSSGIRRMPPPGASQVITMSVNYLPGGVFIFLGFSAADAATQAQAIISYTRSLFVWVDRAAGLRFCLVCSVWPG